MNLHLNEAIIAKITVKKILSQIDYVETLLACTAQEGLAPDLKMVLADWFNEMRVHLRRVEYMTEHAARP